MALRMYCMLCGCCKSRILYVDLLRPVRDSMLTPFLLPPNTLKPFLLSPNTLKPSLATTKHSKTLSFNQQTV